MAAQPQVNKGPALGLPSAAGTVALWSSATGRLALLAHALSVPQYIHPGAPSTPRIGRGQVSEAPTGGNGLKPRRHRRLTRVIRMR